MNIKCAALALWCIFTNQRLQAGEGAVTSDKLLDGNNAEATG
jgi:hypothetical protein